MYLHSAKEICPGWPLIPFFLSFNITNRDKLSANREKLVIENNESKLEDKSNANREESVNNNNENLDNKPSANIKNFIKEKNIN